MRSSVSAKASFTRRWQSSNEPATRGSRRCRRACVISLRCGSLMRPSGKSTTTRNPGTPRKARATALPVSPEVATRTKVSPSTPARARGRRASGDRDGVTHQPRHEARADVLERERRAVEELERPDVVADRNQRDREVEARRHQVVDVSRARSSSPKRWTPTVRITSAARHAAQAREEALAASGSSRSGHHSPPSGARPEKSASVSETAADVPARAHEPHERLASARAGIFHQPRAGAADRRHVAIAGDARHARSARSASRPRRAPRSSVTAAQREHGGTRAREAAAERAGVERRLLHLAERRHLVTAHRLRHHVLERARDQVPVAAEETGDQAGDVGPLHHRGRERDGVAEQRARLARS